MPKHPFWLALVWACLIWYAALLVYVGWKGLADIRRMMRELKEKSRQSG